MGNFGIKRDQEEINKRKDFYYKGIKKRPKIKCLYPRSKTGSSKCKNKVIFSHSIQKSGPLKLLADSSNHVMALLPSFTHLERPSIKPKLTGINEATIFNGLCSKHDDLLFSPIEKTSSVPTTLEHLFLFSYRCLLRELKEMLKSCWD